VRDGLRGVRSGRNGLRDVRGSMGGGSPRGQRRVRGGCDGGHKGGGGDGVRGAVRALE